MCIFANLNTITRGLSYRVGHLQQYYEVLLICQSTKAYHLQLCILFIQKLPSISRQIKIRLADKRIPHKGIFPTSNSVARIWISYLVNVSNVDSIGNYLNNSPSYSRQPTAPIGSLGSGVFPYQSVYLSLKEKILVQVQSRELLLCIIGDYNEYAQRLETIQRRVAQEGLLIVFIFYPHRCGDIFKNPLTSL